MTKEKFSQLNRPGGHREFNHRKVVKLKHSRRRKPALLVAISFPVATRTRTAAAGACGATMPGGCPSPYRGARRPRKKETGLVTVAEADNMHSSRSRSRRRLLKGCRVNRLVKKIALSLLVASVKAGRLSSLRLSFQVAICLCRRGESDVVWIRTPPSNGTSLW